jgi:hypothetical protein
MKYKGKELILGGQYYTHSKTGQEYNKKKKKNFRPMSVMNFNSKISIKYWQTEFNNISKRSYAMIKSISSQGSRDGLP